MPRYQYRCNECDSVLTILHPSDETQTDCLKCQAKDSLVKMLTTFSTNKKGTTKDRVGQVTEQFIEDSRNELKQQKNKLNKDR